MKDFHYEVSSYSSVGEQFAINMLLTLYVLYIVIEDKPTFIFLFNIIMLCFLAAILSDDLIFQSILFIGCYNEGYIIFSTRTSSHLHTLC